MEAILVLLGLVVLAVPIAVVYLLVSQSGLRARVVQLERKIAQLADTQGTSSKIAPDVAVQSALPRVKPQATTPDAAPEAAKAPKPQPVTARTTPAQETIIKEPTGPSRVTLVIAWAAANWFYVVSALSLALAGLFLVQYGVENGLLPPAARVLAAMGFGGALIGAGEWIRRRYGDGPETATAYLPSVFSGAGLVSLFGGVVAARLLYDLIGVEAAFVGMAAVGLLGVVLGWMHGPLLTAVGVIGAFVAPMLVGSSVPATNWLYLYFAIVTAVGLGVDTLRRWGWVSVLSVALGFLMGWLTVLGSSMELLLGFMGYAGALAILAIVVPARSVLPDHNGVLISGWALNAAGPRPAFPTVLAGSAVAAAVAALVFAAPNWIEMFWPSVVLLALLAVLLIVWSTSGPALQDAAALPILGAVAVVVIEGIERGGVMRDFAATYSENIEAAFPTQVTILWAIGLGLSLLAAGRAMRPGLGLVWALGAALIAPAMAIALEVTWQPALVIGAYPWALHAMAMAVVMVGLAVRFARIDGANKTRMSLFVLSALASISFAMVLVLSLSALTVALAVTVLAAALLDRRFDLPLMQIVVVVGVVAVGARLIADPGLKWALVAPVWEILLAYGGALAAFVASLWALQGKQRTTAQVMLDTGAWSTGGTLISVLLFRLLENVTGADNNATHWAMGLYATIWLGLMMAQLLRLQSLTGVLSLVRALLAVVFGFTGLGALLLGLTVLSPLMTDWGGDVAGPALLNTLLVAYLLPAGVLALGAWRLRTRLLLLGFFGVSVALAAVWGFAALRHMWQGAAGMTLDHGFLQPELYSYTVALLVVGAGLFYQSLARASTVLRRAGLVVIGLAVAKVFLIDISDLEGLTRVLSLVVLGLSLAALAWLNRWAQTRYDDT
ncbi:MAG: DUF2339 domain-containing protein [Tateyamaria sp.]|uniref:DUF2339 domain-containing protein n=1 Tax=Tateyamaria sp. TaxID=1929288 RepID=UPI00329AFE72